MLGGEPPRWELGEEESGEEESGEEEVSGEEGEGESDDASDALVEEDEDDLGLEAPPRAAGKAAAASERRKTPARAEDKARRAEERQRAAAEEVPFTFDMPDDQGGLEHLLGRHEVKTQRLVLQRLVACHAVALSPHNRGKLEGLFALLLARVQALAPGSGDEAVPHESLDACVFGLFLLAREIPAHAAAEAIALVVHLETRLAEELQSPDGPGWPSGGELLALRVLPLLFPTSDAQHQVATPLTLLLAHLCASCPVRSLADAAAALFVVAELRACTAPAGRLAPEAPTLLAALLASALPEAAQAKLPPTHGGRALLDMWCLFAQAGGGRRGRRGPGRAAAPGARARGAGGRGDGRARGRALRRPRRLRGCGACCAALRAAAGCGGRRGLCGRGGRATRRGGGGRGDARAVGGLRSAARARAAGEEGRGRRGSAARGGGSAADCA